MQLSANMYICYIWPAQNKTWALPTTKNLRLWVTNWSKRMRITLTSIGYTLQWKNNKCWQREAKMLGPTNTIDNHVQTCDRSEALQGIEKHLRAALSLIKVFGGKEDKKRDKALTVKRKISPNENNDKQLHFFFNKKKRKIASTTISKPSLIQNFETKRNLREKELNSAWRRMT